ncbi:TetR/AcrR family transcriptional regulator [Paraliomyxa miuraensis]|uniref:TetR/AcrR family transcriptional regulator n=1 Tax=Paraliomyxa miuraensis TaxID=376150 RepID=UPI002251A02B|nr:TetR/AcrR family transcriptional regulator [Paraliomyxa miuraensis]MCX4247907.1 TetR/AcrR family transcriptional regulator [Paraliomyxa miuraensis]
MRPRQFTDDELLQTARRCFLEHGPGVSTNAIAEELGVSQAALFKRFKTKQDLMVEALAPGAQPPWIAEVEAGPDDSPVPEQLHRVVKRIDAFFEQMLPGIAMLRAAGIEPEVMLRHHEVPPPVRAHRTLSAWLRRLHEQGRANVPHPQSTAMAFLGAIHARHMLCHMLREHAPKTEPEFLQNLVDVFWAGIAPAPQET